MVERRHQQAEQEMIDQENKQRKSLGRSQLTTYSRKTQPSPKKNLKVI